MRHYRISSVVTRHVRGRVRALVGLVLLLATSSSANVSLKNGNYFVSFVDLVYTGGFEPRIERVYNSKSAYRGFFGWGWGTEYETRLRPAADGSVWIDEFGSGAQNRFVAGSATAQQVRTQLAGSVGALVAAARKAGAIPSAEAQRAYEQKLRNNVEYRLSEYETYVRRKLLKPVSIPVGTQLISARYNFQYLSKVAGGFVRTRDSGKRERFDEAGRLVRIDDKNGNYIALSYSKSGRLERIQDNFNRKMFLTLNSRGLIERVQGESGKIATYRYNDQDELVSSRDADGNAFEFGYSTDRRHNLTRIGFADRTRIEIAYQPVARFENVRSVRDRDGTINEYEFAYEGVDRIARVGVRVRDAKGTIIGQSSYEYVNGVKPDGERFTERLISVVDGDRSETVYGPLGLPTRIKRSGSESRFDYDAVGRLLRRVTDLEDTSFVYDPKISKIVRVVRRDRLNPSNKPRVSTFGYDRKGNLEQARDSTGKAARLFYDSQGRVVSLVDQSKQRLNFVYNELGKPTRITDPKRGTLQITYNTAGDVDQVESPQGREVMAQVGAAFQNLLELIKPAGVSINL